MRGADTLHALTPAVLVAIVYGLTAWVGVRLQFPGAGVSMLWLGNAVMLAALLLAPRRQWWLYLLLCLPAHLLVLLPGDEVSALRALVQYAVNCTTALIGALALTAVAPDLYRIERVRSAVALILLGGLLAPLSTSLLLATALVVLDLSQTFWLTTYARTATNSFAILTVVPLVLHAAAWARNAEHSLPPARATEAGLLTVGLLTLGSLGFIAPQFAIEHSAAVLYAPFAVLLLAAVRFGVAGSCASMLLLGTLSIFGLLGPSGAYVGESPNQSAISVTLFLVLTSASMLLLPAALEERRTLERANAANRARFRNIFEANIIPTILWRPGSVIVEANPSFFELTEYRPADLSGGRLFVSELLIRRPTSPGPSGLSTLDTDGGHIECSLVARSGRRIPVLVCGARFPGFFDEGATHLLDLSSLRRAESDRHRAEVLHSAVLASIHDQIAVLDQAGTIIETNQSWRRFVEQSHDQHFERGSVGDPYLTICATAAAGGDATAAELLECIRDVLANVTPRRRIEFSRTTLAGDLLWHEISVESLHRPEGGVVITRADISARKQAMSEAREQRQQLAHLGRAAILGELSGAFAHELAQPLTSILGNAEAALQLLPQGGNLAEVEDILRDIVRDDVRAAEVIGRLRSMLTRGEIHRETVDLNQVVREVLTLTHSDLVTRNVAVVLQLESHAPPVRVDRVQMQQVVLNLIVNACEAMAGVPSGERRLCISTRTMDSNALECAIADRGHGLPPGEAERIFQPFVTTKNNGLGLGLAISRSIVEAHGGRLWAESAPEGGAIFHFTAPVGG
jgi:signal transduction histidine kinase/integral membrane sensor domain MASE1